MEYWARITREGNDRLVTFPDIPQVNTFGESLDEALENAEEALNGVLISAFERGYTAPAPQPYSGREYHKVAVWPNVALAYELRTLRGHLTQQEIAKRLEVSYQAYQQLENPRRCNPTIKTLRKIAGVYGKKLQVEIK
jgi:antitoxin HicB